MIKELLEDYQYNNLHIEIQKDKRKKIDEGIYEEYGPSCTQTLTDMPKGSCTSDSTANTAIKIITVKDEKLVECDKMIADSEQQIRIVDSLIATLKFDDQQIIKKRHFDKKAWEQIQQEIMTKDGLNPKYSEWGNVEDRYRTLIKKMENTYKKCK